MIAGRTWTGRRSSDSRLASRQPVGVGGLRRRTKVSHRFTIDGVGRGREVALGRQEVEANQQPAVLITEQPFSSHPPVIAYRPRRDFLVPVRLVALPVQNGYRRSHGGRADGYKEAFS